VRVYINFLPAFERGGEPPHPLDVVRRCCCFRWGHTITEKFIMNLSEFGLIHSTSFFSSWMFSLSVAFSYLKRAIFLIPENLRDSFLPENSWKRKYHMSGVVLNSMSMRLFSSITLCWIANVARAL
jgi:hypothetical protein